MSKPGLRLSTLALAAAVTFGFASTDALALALGRVTVQSALGEPLRAEIDVPQIAPDEVASLKANIAPATLFQQQGLEFNPTLNNVTITLQRRPNGSYFLGLASDRPVNEPFVDVILEATWASGRVQRDFTMLFDPPALRQPQAPLQAQVTPRAGTAAAPRTAPAPAVAAPAAPPAVAARPAPAPSAPTRTAPTPARPPATASAPAAAAGGEPGKRVTVHAGDTAGKLASANKPGSVSLDQMLVAMLRANPEAFVDGNINRLRSGAVMDLPSAEQASSVDPADAHQTLTVQSRDFNEFRRRLAEGVPAAGAPSASREASGRVQAQVEDRKPGAAAPDRLTLSKGAVQGKASNADQIARERANRDTQTRVAELNKNIQDLNRLTGGTAGSAGGGTGARAPGVTAPAGVTVPATAQRSASSPAAAATARAASTPAAVTAPATARAASAPAAVSAARPESAPTPASTATTTAARPASAATPVTPAAAVAVPKAASSAPATTTSGSPAPTSTTAPAATTGAATGASPAASGAAAVPATGAASGASLTASAARPAASVGAAVAAARPLPRRAPPPPPPEPSFLDDLLENPLVPALGVGLLAVLLGFGFYKMRQKRKTAAVDSSFLESRLQPDSFFGASGGQRIDTAESNNPTGSSMVYSPSQLDAAGDVDPVAEADVYLAYGRDLQAEEILKEALRINPQRVAIHAKLLEIYAKRRDAKAFEVVAAEAYNLTQGNGPEWEHICDLGRELDAANPMYRPGAHPVAAAAATAATAAVASAAAASRPAPAPVAAPARTAPPPGDLDLDLDFSLGDEPETVQSPEARAAAPARAEPPPLEMDFSRPVAPAPAARAELPSLPAHDNSLNFEPVARAPAPTAAPAPAPAAARGDMLEFDLGGLSLDLPGSPAPAAAPSAPKAPVIPPEPAMNLDLPPLATAGDDISDNPLATKLALAEEFNAIGDADGARSLAEEVVAEASGDLKSRAQRLLAEIG